MQSAKNVAVYYHRRFPLYQLLLHTVLIFTPTPIYIKLKYSSSLDIFTLTRVINPLITQFRDKKIILRLLSTDWFVIIEKSVHRVRIITSGRRVQEIWTICRVCLASLFIIEKSYSPKCWAWEPSFQPWKALMFFSSVLNTRSTSWTLKSIFHLGMGAIGKILVVMSK